MNKIFMLGCADMIIDCFKKFSTRSKLIIIYILSVTIITFILIFVFQFFGKDIFRAQVQSQLSALAKSKSAQVFSIIEQDLERINLIASRTQMRHSLIEIENNPDDSGQNLIMLTNILEDASKSVSAIRSIDILNLDGMVVASSVNNNIGKNDSNNATFFNALENSYQGEFNEDDNGKRFYTLSMPLLNPNSTDSEAIGVVRVEISLMRLMSVLEDYVGLGETGETLLISNEGEKVILLNSFRIDRNEMLLDNIARMLNANKSFKPEDTFESNNFLAHAKVPLDRKNWHIIALINTEEVLEPFHTLYIYILFFSLFLILAGCFFIVYGINHSFKNIRKLAEGAQRFGEGNLDYRVDISEKDEVGMLSLHFNNMANHISSQIETITKSKTELEKAKMKVESANLSKSQFLANMSHEIRTPINSITGFLQLLKDTPLNTDQNNYVKLMQSSSDTLLSVINDILDISKIESGKLELERIDFDLKETIKNAVFSLSAKVNEKNLKLDISLEENLPQYVVGDPTRLKQIIINMVSNAIKFTKNGEIQVSVSIDKSAVSSEYIKFLIKDTGIGMTNETLIKLFKPFMQADSSSARMYGGTGLGLTICKAYVEAMGGTIQVKSEMGKGSEFSFIVPLSNSSHDFISSPVSTVTSSSANNEKIKILLVEDNEVNCIFVTKLLQLHGLVCDIAVNGEDALNACSAKNYDLIFMDCHMPVMDGYETTRKIRALEGNRRHTRIIAMTACAMEDDRQKCIDAGMDDYISKPVKFDMIYQVILSINQSNS